MNNDQPAIAVDFMTKRFGDFVAVDGVSFTVQHGEIFGFIGPNGSGKTTTIRMMLGLIRPTAGSVEILGMPVDGKSSKIRPRVGYMSQRFSLYNDLTVFQNLRFYGTAYGLSGNELETRIEQALSMSGLEGRQSLKTRELSGGWRQRLALSAAILHSPQVLFLDEPTAGVDPLSRRDFWNMLYQFTAQGVAVFVTTHYMDEAEHCQRLAFIQHGKIIACGSPDEVKAREMRGQVLEIEPSDAPMAINVLRSANENGKLLLSQVELYGSLVHVVAIDMAKQQAVIAAELSAAGILISHMTIIEPTLEDVFISCMNPQ